MTLIHLVDDDAAVRRSASFLLKTSGYDVVPHPSGEAFLKDAAPDRPACVLLDVRMPGMDGLTVQQALREQGRDWPVILLTGHGDVATAVRAMKAGAVDFLEKPFEKAALLAAIGKAQARLERDRDARIAAEQAKVRLSALTPREREILDGLAQGLSNKGIASALAISPRTVEIHRARLMQKLEVQSLAELLRLKFLSEGGAGR